MDEDKLSAIIKNNNLYIVLHCGLEIFIDNEVETIIKTEDFYDCYNVSYCKQDGRKAELCYYKESNEHKIFIEAKKHCFWDKVIKD